MLALNWIDLAPDGRETRFATPTVACIRPCGRRSSKSARFRIRPPLVAIRRQPLPRRDQTTHALVPHRRPPTRVLEGPTFAKLSWQLPARLRPFTLVPDRSDRCWPSVRYPCLQIPNDSTNRGARLEAAMDVVDMKASDSWRPIGRIELGKLKEPSTMGKHGAAKQGRAHGGHA